MYGTRDAARNWAMSVETTMVEAGFEVGKSNPCLFYNPGRQVAALCHGDDFVAQGKRKHLQWLEK